MEQSGGRSRFLCWELVGLICFAGRGHLQTREIKGNQGKSREIKGNKGNKGNKGDQGESREIKGNKGNSGIQGEIRNPR